MNRKVRRHNLTLTTNARQSEICVAYSVFPSTALTLSLKENRRYKARSQNVWIADRRFAVWLRRKLTSAVLEVSDIHIVNCIATLMSAGFPQDVTDIILPLDQSMQHIQYKKYTFGVFRLIILEFLCSSWHFQNEDEFTIEKTMILKHV